MPALFRSALAKTKDTDDDFHGVVLFASHKHDCIEACALDRMSQLAESIDDLDLFSDTQDDLAASIFADAHQVPIDGDGRIILPTDLAAHAGISSDAGGAAFIGRGKTFQIWNPDAFEAHKKEARKRAQAKDATLKLRRGKDEAKNED